MGCDGVLLDRGQLIEARKALVWLVIWLVWYLLAAESVASPSAWPWGRYSCGVVMTRKEI